MAENTEITLPCAQCGFSNEPERVYCHNCGAKLDRSLLPKAAKEKKEDSPEKARRRIQKMTNPSKISVLRELKTLISLLIWAALAAGVIMIARRPDGVPAISNEMATRQVQSDLMETVDAPTPRAVAFTEQEVNLALRQALRAKDVGGVPGTNFEQAYVSFLPGIVHLGLEQSIAGYSLFCGIDYELAIKQGVLAPTLKGGSFGRIAVRPEIMQYLDFPFQKLWKALKREHEQLQKMQNVTVTKGQITLVSKGAAAR
ncbi:MAG: hypothetical protein QOE70_3083 [Chthoniobacter sp.]|jgi:hypothetical protein|nr:hypothetical protein [Chthoniobacter sp.]